MYVYAVEASSIAEYTRQLVKQNDCEEVVTVLQGRAEETELPVQVDVLVSEWMGNCLLFEFMVESVLLARDRWLRKGGVMWPSSAALALVPCQAESYYAEKIAFWEQPYGLDFTPLQPLAQKEFFTKPKFSHLIDPSDCLSAPCDIITMDMYTLQVEDLEEMKGQFHFCVERSGVFHGFTAWFTAHFESLETEGATVELNTGPNSEPTHWKQTLFMLDRPVRVYEGDSISGSIVLHRNPIWRRHMTVTLQWNINSSKEETDNCQANIKTFTLFTLTLMNNSSIMLFFNHCGSIFFMQCGFVTYMHRQKVLTLPLESLDFFCVCFFCICVHRLEQRVSPCGGERLTKCLINGGDQLKISLTHPL
ncbi:arginine N-methyltransferase 2 [Solea senegalensis]|uniref:Arginine N-methyltransferase 2 n=1 Tax=Solea senegalensis TaxID=28829 RepID=A0AAV6RD96_SOLSE|nr:arginine N-methyltransferase 2 [Solea senegalensis]